MSERLNDNVAWGTGRRTAPPGSPGLRRVISWLQVPRSERVLLGRKVMRFQSLEVYLLMKFFLGVVGVIYANSVTFPCHFKYSG